MNRIFFRMGWIAAAVALPITAVASSHRKVPLIAYFSLDPTALCRSHDDHEGEANPDLDSRFYFSDTCKNPKVCPWGTGPLTWWPLVCWPAGRRADLG